ncbi:BEL1-like homeodomain 1 [Olea europaea subsp. europaea]|uniref:BEL1-like homeodomain 1 n=1 Tax=Olea europaea subsp. europaea TaxID=158383 RepID=A0A8S0PN53_OLEEU|nr:BEL1-like homeodomain 1 [Olea europaea subsp. europaea]
MAMYYQGSSEIQADGLQTLYLMNPNYVGYSDNTEVQKPANVLFFNSAATATGREVNTAQMSHTPLSQSQHFVGVPLSAAVGSPNSYYHNHPSVLGQQEIQASHGAIPSVHYNLWKSVEQAAGVNQQNISSVVAATNSGDSRPAVSPTQQGLSLTLSPQQRGYRSLPTNNEITVSPKLGSSTSLSAASNGVNDLQSVILGSKYLKAAQQLLDELVVLGKGTKTDEVVAGEAAEKRKITRESTGVKAEAFGTNGCETELTTAQRQELQMKKAKLINMLDEVELRYKQYHQQMQIVVASFEMAAGFGSAKSYTQLALKTISKQFRCLRDAISAQLKEISKSLGDVENSGKKFEGSKLKFVDHQFQQQRSLQQLGMMQNSAWRPQRGLPERAVTVLRAWLFENFLHPYPKDSDKHMLAKQTGLTRSQVSNWFINARVRLWKPMVEEMYLEEMKNQDSNISDENKSKSTGAAMRELVSKSIALEESNNGNIEEILGQNSKKPRNGKHNSPSNSIPMPMEAKAADQTSKGLSGDNYLTLMAADTSHSNRFDTYAIEELGRYNGPEQLGTRFHGNNVFLTLGLPPAENIKLGTRIETAGTVENNYNRVNNLQEHWLS